MIYVVSFFFCFYFGYEFIYNKFVLFKFCLVFKFVCLIMWKEKKSFYVILGFLWKIVCCL